MAFEVPRNKDEWSIYRERELRIYTPSGNFLGKFDGISEKGYIHLRPSLSSEGLTNPDGTDCPRVRIERKVPAKVAPNTITGITPLGDGYIERLANSINSVVPQNLFSPYPSKK